ncbi:FAD-dependent oxidoreductase [Thermocrispum municipale]|uniref:FAD-dependent oxidoreductase n=1 Tax=Thermocrispum municipale TaxID=37926 RepID=UPI0003FAF3E7|nr:GMC family oxidoreductase [Thermocrispum municipale]
MRSAAPEERADVVVVGSGFGGSVSAYRLAEAGQDVVLLERGRAYPPGSFPRNPREMSRAFWDPTEGLQGMFDVWTFRGFDSLVSSGLGGGSLIYANVMIRKDERWFVCEDPLPGGGYETWPVTRAELDPHYDAVERMLNVSPYPFESPAYAGSRKTHAMREAAEKLGLEWSLPPLAVSFSAAPGQQPAIGLPLVDPPYGNLHGVQRKSCRLCGECNIGCNDGAKNSLDHTYLSAAAAEGADIRPRCEVRTIEALEGGGYRVGYVEHLPENEGRDVDWEDMPRHTIVCRRLVLAAGTYGTTLLLLRNRETLPGLSDALGTKFSGNGDLLTFLMPADDEENVRQFGASEGPVITSALRVPDAVDEGVTGECAERGFYIQDGGYPAFAEWIAETSGPKSLWRIGAFLGKWLLTTLKLAPDNSLGAELSDLLGDGTLSAGALPLLGMGRDVPDGVMRLDGDRLDVEWTSETSMAYFERMRSTMRQIADALGTGFVDNPMWFFRRIVTVHPLGGAPIGDHPGEAVCDANGEVFGHPGLYIADGAAMPGPVGPNPSLTIAAMADRMCTRMLERSTEPV